MFKILMPAVTALGLVAFAAKTQPMVSDLATAHVDAPAAVTAMNWHISKEGAMAKLAYGVVDSDQLAMMITCAPGDVTAAVYGDVRPARAIKADLDERRVPLRDPDLRDLASKGEMAVVSDEGSARIQASPSERRAIGQFLDYCSRKQA